MLVERGLKVMNVEVVGDAYAIASNYLRKTGAIPDIIATNDLCSKSSSSCSTAANATGFASPTRRSRGSKPNSSDPLQRSDPHRREDFMEAAIDRIMQTYALLVNQHRCRDRRGAGQGDRLHRQAVRGRRKRPASPDRVRADLFARARRLTPIRSRPVLPGFRAPSGGVHRLSPRVTNDALAGVATVTSENSPSKVAATDQLLVHFNSAEACQRGRPCLGGRSQPIVGPVKP